MPTDLVQTSNGTLRGTVAEVRRFLGIPFAAPPVGPRRWRPPEPLSAWSGIRVADRFGADCPQRSNRFSRAAGTDEDCLTLNIWTPERSPRPLPVMLWFPGGGFVGGTASDRRTDGTVLAQQGVVVVTANYRTGIFGYFAHPALTAEAGSSGNYGLLDQIAALRWVQDHIADFGGDPERVTIGGVSAGAASAALLMIATTARGLFHRAILQSPGSMRPLATLSAAEAEGWAVDPDLARLRASPAASLLDATSYYTDQPRSITQPRVLRPIIDHRLIDENEIAAHEAGRQAAVPVLVGSNHDEGLQLVAGWPINTVAAYHAFLEAQFGDRAEDALRCYPVAGDEDVCPALGDVFGDTQFSFGAATLARCSAVRAKAWRYLFAFRAAGQATGPHHGEETAFAFGLPAVVDNVAVRPAGAEADALSARMVSGWAAFLSGGDPGWPACDGTGEPYLILDREDRLDRGWRAEQIAFLRSYHVRREAD